MNSLSSKLYYISVVSPSVLVGFFVLLSVFNQNLKGLAYLVGICVLFTSMSTLQNMLKIVDVDSSTSSAQCKSYGLFGGKSGGLSYGILVYVFTFFYLLLPMIINGIINMPLLFLLALMTIIDSIINVSGKCIKTKNIFISIIFGCLIGVSWSLLIYSIKPELTYHTDYITSNKLACSLPSKQNFKCVVKKNGEIIG
tara:strand:- start:49 stop:639 length:591 start_codon:yes stop_codon:yes gene_type:complete